MTTIKLNDLESIEVDVSHWNLDELNADPKPSILIHRINLQPGFDEVVDEVHIPFCVAREIVKDIRSWLDAYDMHMAKLRHERDLQRWNESVKRGLLPEEALAE